jgi:GNAT superfamily N-acetyltransferase
MVDSETAQAHWPVERAMALIQIAHPKFRPWLIAEAKTRKLVYTDQIELPLRAPVYPDDLERWIELKDGARAFLRPLKLTDEAALQDMFYRLSPESIHYRFFRMIKSISHEKLQQVLQVDYDADIAFVVLTDAGPDAAIVAVAHYSNDPRTNFADAAFLVRDDWQGRGIGTEPMNALVDAALTHGIGGFTANVLILKTIQVSRRAERRDAN